MAATQGKKVLNFEVTPAEDAAIREIAAWFDMPLATYLRYAALGGVVDPEENKGKRRRKIAAEARELLALSGEVAA